MGRLFIVALCAAGSCLHAQATDPPRPPGFLQSAFTPGASLKLALGLLYEQATVTVPEWKPGRAGLARRAEYLAASWITNTTTEYAVARLRNIDARYRPCACKGFPRRAAHALLEGFVEYRADGTPVFALAGFSGLAAGSLVPMPMLPGRYGFRDAANRAALTFGVDEGINVLHEFRKEIVRTLLFRGK